MEARLYAVADGPAEEHPGGGEGVHRLRRLRGRKLKRADDDDDEDEDDGDEMRPT